MSKAIAIGCGLFLLILIVRAPAGLLSLVLSPDEQATLLDLDGTLWAGNGELLVDGNPLGRLNWRFQPVTLLHGKIGYDLSLTGPDVTLNGQLSAGSSRSTATLDGQVDSNWINPWLAAYDIRLAGEFQLQDVEMTLNGRHIGDTRGRLNWDGGPVTYILSGKMHNSSLPAMYADLGPGPVAVAYATGSPTPLLLAELKADGFAKVGVTKYLTKILGNPWPGSDPDHAVVLEVEEQVF